MFTGIVEKSVRILEVEQHDRFRRLVIESSWSTTGSDAVSLGQSISVNGCCLTVATLEAARIGFDVIPESLAKTNLGVLNAGDSVHVERALRVGDRIDGHFVQGHVDGPATLLQVSANNMHWRMTVEVSPDLSKFLAPKGSVTLDGVSLTIASLNGNQFDVAIIPTTLRLTNFASRQEGWRFNYEADILSKQIVHFLEQRQLDR